LGGYSDWFLPSKDELNAMYGKKAAIGGFVNASFWYWSSSEFSGTNARGQTFGVGSQNNYNKSTLDHVRAVRAF
jgi:hypothetical protein